METIAENLQVLNEAKLAIKSAIEEKGQDLTDVPFTAYASKIAEISSNGVEITSGSFTKGTDYSLLTLAHGLSKPPKLVVCFLKGYLETVGTLLAGFIYTEKVASLYRFGSVSNPSLASSTVHTTPVQTPANGAISADATNLYISGPPTQWTAGDYEWEAFTW